MLSTSILELIPSSFREYWKTQSSSAVCSREHYEALGPQMQGSREMEKETGPLWVLRRGVHVSVSSLRALYTSLFVKMSCVGKGGAEVCLGSGVTTCWWHFEAQWSSSKENVKEGIEEQTQVVASSLFSCSLFMISTWNVLHRLTCSNIWSLTDGSIQEGCGNFRAWRMAKGSRLFGWRHWGLQLSPTSHPNLSFLPDWHPRLMSCFILLHYHGAACHHASLATKVCPVITDCSF